MKKILVLLTVAVALFGFSAGAFAQALDVCSTCEKCLVGSVPCTIAGQGGLDNCSYFDYETGAGYIPSSRGTGYCRAIFSICNCLNAGTTFVAGKRFGVALTILVNGLPGQRGAYWSQPASASIEFGMFDTLSAACGVSATYTRSFGPGTFFKSDSAGKSTTTVSSLAGGTTCAVGASNQATRIVTNIDQGYIITPADELAKLSRWWINIPEIRIDPNVLHNGEKISVKIETLDLQSGGICADCVVTCECVIDVAYVCPAGSTSAMCLFPYFTSTTAPNDALGQPWWNGIAITNTSAYPGTATLSVYQQDGKTGTYTTPTIPAGSIWVKPLEVVPFSGGLGGLPVWIKVTTTFPTMDGFGIMADTSTGESMGYLCRQSH